MKRREDATRDLRKALSPRCPCHSSHGAAPGGTLEIVRIGLLWRAEWDPVDGSARIAETCKLHGMFAAFAALGIAAEPVVYSDDAVDAVHDQLVALDGVLVWVNPIEQGLDRSKLDPLLRDVAGQGVWVSAHPDVILKMGTKQVLADTRSMSWGAGSRQRAARSCSSNTAAWEATASGRSKRPVRAGSWCSTPCATHSRSA